jgi:hypothetical protein
MARQTILTDWRGRTAADELRQSSQISPEVESADSSFSRMVIWRSQLAASQSDSQHTTHAIRPSVLDAAAHPTKMDALGAPSYAQVVRVILSVSSIRST